MVMVSPQKSNTCEQVIEVAYISRLADEEDHIDFIGHRLGSLNGDDIYEVVSRDGHDWRYT